MSEQNNTSTPEGSAVAAPEQNTDAAEKPPGYVPRSAIAEQVTPLKEKLTAYESELQQYRQAEEKRKLKELEETKNWDQLKADYEARLSEIQSKFEATTVAQKRTELKSSLVAAGLNPEDPRDKLTIDGILSGYDPKSDPSEWFKAFRESNAAVFEKPAYTRTTGPTGAPPNGVVHTDVDQLVQAYRRGSPQAIEEVVNLNRQGRLTSDLAAKLGIG